MLSRYPVPIHFYTTMFVWRSHMMLIIFKISGQISLRHGLFSVRISDPQRSNRYHQRQLH
uniref:Uncharacterized protein n=1 Tax=Parascaris equorum TaxID=6256 RepID=A0A914RHU6_PAREQ